MTYRNNSTDRLFKAVLSLNNLEECYAFFEDACTVKEIVEISQRFEVARMLSEKRSYQSITEQTGVSSATIGRVNRSLCYGTGGYKMAMKRLEDLDSKEQENADK